MVAAVAALPNEITHRAAQAVPERSLFLIMYCPRLAPESLLGEETILYATCHSKTAEPPYIKELRPVTKMVQNFFCVAQCDILLRCGRLPSRNFCVITGPIAGCGRRLQ